MLRRRRKKRRRREKEKKEKKKNKKEKEKKKKEKEQKKKIMLLQNLTALRADVPAVRGFFKAAVLVSGSEDCDQMSRGGSRLDHSVLDSWFYTLFNPQ